ncbi:DUF5686 family protein, partial [Arthrospira platensis SPKY1]|nr:DUF5686 family protein [Arthrospira platensis SPKY1]
RKLTSKLEYGFADRKLLGTIGFRQIIDNKTGLKYSVEGGRHYRQPSGQEMVNSLFNIYTALYYGNNYLKLYGRDHLKLEVNRNFKAGFTVLTRIELQRRF